METQELKPKIDTALLAFFQSGNIMKSMNKKLHMFVLGVMMLAVIAPLFTFAAIVPCGTKTTQPCTLCDLFKLGQTATNTLTLVVAPLIAVLAFTLGGFKILISGANPGYRQEGFKAIRNGVIGLLIVFTAWIVVNEFLLFFVGSQNVTSLAPWTKISCYNPLNPPASTTSVPPSSSDAAIRQILTNAGINFSSTGNCTDPTKPTCTSVQGLPQNAINGLLALKASCGCSLTITGGTEVGHKTHGQGEPNVDLRIDNQANPWATPLGIYINSNRKGSPSYSSLGATYTLPNATYLLEIDTKTGVTHWHVVFK